MLFGARLPCSTAREADDRAHCIASLRRTADVGDRGDTLAKGGTNDAEVSDGVPWELKLCSVGQHKGRLSHERRTRR
jgi:hypothetical protein